MSMRTVRLLLAAALAITVGSPVVSATQGGPPRGNDRQGAPRKKDQQRDSLENRFKDRIDAIVKQRLQLTDEHRCVKR